MLKLQVLRSIVKLGKLKLSLTGSRTLYVAPKKINSSRSLTLTHRAFSEELSPNFQ